jgi:hypothetical protein
LVVRVVAELADELIGLRCRADVTSHITPSVVAVGVRYVAGAIRHGASRAETVEVIIIHASTSQTSHQLPTRLTDVIHHTRRTHLLYHSRYTSRTVIHILPSLLVTRINKTNTVRIRIPQHTRWVLSASVSNGRQQTRWSINITPLRHRRSRVVFNLHQIPAQEYSYLCSPGQRKSWSAELYNIPPGSKRFPTQS